MLAAIVLAAVAANGTLVEQAPCPPYPNMWRYALDGFVLVKC